MNKVILIGRLTKDPELKYIGTNNTPVCNFTLAVNRTIKKDETDFINIVAWNKTAELCSQYLAKGKKASVVGELQTRTWEDKNKTKHTISEVVISEVEFLDSKPAGTSAPKPAETSSDEEFVL